MSAGYRSDGLRAWKQASGGAKTYYLYDSANQPVCELSASGSVAACNSFGADGLISRRNVGASVSTFYTFDPEGNVAQRLDSTGSVISSDTYDGFANFQTTASSLASDPFGYGAQWGYYTDRETGLILCGHRYYDPTTGRWLNRDPIGYAGGVNLYETNGDNPITNIDPSGHGFYQWIYTGDWNAPDDVYNAALDTAADNLPTRSPDYYSVNVSGGPLNGALSVLGFAGQVVVDRYGHEYIGPVGASAGRPNPNLKVSVCVVAGWLNQGGSDGPSECDLSDFISGASYNWTIADVLSAGQTYSTVGSGSNVHWQHANEFGLGTPQIGVNTTYTLTGPQVKNIGQQILNFLSSTLNDMGTG